MVKTKQAGNQNIQGTNQTSTSTTNLLTPHKKAIKSNSNINPGEAARKAAMKAARICRKSVINPAFKAVLRVRKTVVVNREERPTGRFDMISIPKRSFQVICREFAEKYMRNCRFTKEALATLQLAVEDYMVGFFEDTMLCVNHAKRKTLMRQDLLLVCRLRKLDYIPI